MDTFPEGTVLYGDGTQMLAITLRDEKTFGGRFEHAFVLTNKTPDADSESMMHHFQELAVAEYQSISEGDRVVLTQLDTNLSINCMYFPEGDVITFDGQALGRLPWPEEFMVSITYIPDPLSP